MEHQSETGSKVHFFYVLWCRDNTFYGGYTTDLSRREKEHNSGRGAKYTKPKSRRPADIIYAEIFDTRSQAMSAEYHFKKRARADKESYLKKKGVSFPLKRNRKLIVADQRKEVRVFENSEKLQWKD